MIFTLIAVLEDVVSWRNSLYVEPLSVLMSGVFTVVNADD